MLPFALRWITKEWDEKEVKGLLIKILGDLISYPEQIKQDYAYGFVTDVESVRAPKGLNKEVQ